VTENEKKLLRQQAEAYAFIHDLRRTAVLNGDGRYVRLTEGIDERIKLRQQQYPTVFKRYFNEALKRGEKERIRNTTRNNAPPVKEDGKRKDIQKREETTQKETQAEKVAGGMGTVARSSGRGSNQGTQPRTKPQATKKRPRKKPKTKRRIKPKAE
jgi:hypothetical protein